MKCFEDGSELFARQPIKCGVVLCPYVVCQHSPEFDANYSAKKSLGGVDNFTWTGSVCWNARAALMRFKGQTKCRRG